MKKLTRGATRLIVLALGLCLLPSAWADFTKTNPVTGETENYTWKFVGTDTWNGSQYWQDSTGANPADGGVPAKTSGGDIWDPILFDGDNISIAASMSVEGWNLRLGLYNGANVRLNTFPKWQGDTNMWVTVDGTSKFTVGGFGGGNLADNKIIKCSTSRENGIEWLVNLATGNNTANNTFEYYLAGSGSVSYQAVSAANHKIKMADVTLSSGEKSVQSKTLISFTSSSRTFTADATIKVLANDVVVGSDLLVSVNTTGSTTLTTSDRVGACELVQTSTGIILYYVDGPAYEEKTYTPSINLNFTHSGAGIDTAADIGLAGYAVPGSAWNNIAGKEGTTTETIKKIDARGAVTVDAGVSVEVSTTRGSYRCNNLAAATDLRHGYIDESDAKATPTVTITGIPYDNYRVIVYHATDSGNVPFGYDTINGNNFTYVNGVQTIGTDSWGNSGAYDGADAIAEGVNTLVSGILSGSTVTMVAHRIGTGTPSARGCFAAIQVVEVALNENDLIIPVNGDTVYTVSENKNLENVYVTGVGTLTFDGEGAITAAAMDVDTGAVVTIDETRLSATKITGSGTVIYDGSQPDATKGFSNAVWTGTVWVKNVGSNGTTAKVNTGLGTADTTDASSNLLNSWGNASSFVKFTNVRGYTSAANCPWTLILEDDTSDPEDVKYAWYDNNGWTARSATIAGLKGSGTFYDANFTDCRQAINFTDASGFTGSIYAQGKRIGLGGATTIGDAAANAGSIEVVSGATATLASGSTWTANAGITVNGTLNADGTLACLNGSSTSAVKGSGTVVFAGRAPTPTGNAWWKNADWTGTVEIKQITDMVGRTSGYAGTYLDFNSYGNAGSLIKLGNITGWMDNYTCNVPVNLAGTLTINNGVSGETFTFKKLISNAGYITATDQSATFSIRIEDGSEYAGYIGLNSKRVIFGTGTAPDFVKGQIYVSSDARITVPSVNTAYWAVGSILVDGELKADNLNRFGGGTNITTGDNGIFTLTSTGNGTEGETDTDYTRIQGTGSLKYEGTGWRALSTNNFPTAVTLVNEQAGDLLLSRALTYTVGSLAGSKNFQGNYGSGNRYLNIIQSKDTEWSGNVINDNSSRLAGFTIDAASTGTLTYSGTGALAVPLAINGGAVKITGTWKGSTTVAGTIGGTGTLTGNLTFSAGSTFKAYATDDADGLVVSGTITYPEEGKVAVKVSSTFEGEAVLITATGLDASKFELATGAPSGAELVVDGNTLKVTAPATVAMLVNTTAGQMLNYESVADAVEALSEMSGSWTLYVMKGDNAVSALTVQSGLSLTVMVSGGTLAVTTATVDASGALIVRGGTFSTINVAGSVTVWAASSRTSVVITSDGYTLCRVYDVAASNVEVTTSVSGKVASADERTEGQTYNDYILEDSPSSGTYVITGETALDATGSFTVPAGTTTIMLGGNDVTAGFTINGTTATLNAPEVVDGTDEKAVDVGATTVTLNVDLVPGLYYGVASGTGLTFSRPAALTQYTGENDADILTVAKPSTEKGFFKVFVDIKE